MKELPGNIDNLASLMVTHIDEDKLELKERIKASLRKLIQETLIQQNGDEYIFLTDDEQDVNNEIKQVRVEDNAIKDSIGTYVFEDIYDVKKFSYSKVYDFSFNRSMDEKTFGKQTAPIGVELLSPLSTRYDRSDQDLQMQSSGNDNVIIKLGSDGSYVDEMEAALKIEAYRRGRNIHELPENIQNILNNKQVEARQRRNRAREILVEAIKDSSFYINGTKVDIKGSTVKEKISGALKILIDNKYTKLSHITSHINSEQELKDLIKQTTRQTSLDDNTFSSENAQAMQDIKDYVQLQREMNQQIVVKTIFDQFMNAPYGWRQLDIASLIIELLKDQHIRIRYNAVFLEPELNVDELMAVLTKLVESAKAIVTFREEIDANLIRTVRRGARDLFDKSDLAEDEDGLVKDIRASIDQKIEEIHAYKKRYENRPYPGMSLLDKGLEHFEQFDRSIDNLTFFKRFKDAEDDIGFWLEDIQYVTNFFESNQKNLYDEGLATIQYYKDIKNYIDSEEVKEAMSKLSNILKNPIPYGEIKDIPEYKHILNEYVNQLLEEKKQATTIKVQNDFDEVTLRLNDYGLSEETKKEIKEKFNHLLHRIEQEQEIHKVDAIVAQSITLKENSISKINKEIKEWMKKKEEGKHQISDNQNNEVDNLETESKPPKTETEVINVGTLVESQKLTTEAEVDAYINTLSRKLKDIIKANKHIEFKN